MAQSKTEQDLQAISKYSIAMADNIEFKTVIGEEIHYDCNEKESDGVEDIYHNCSNYKTRWYQYYP